MCHLNEIELLFYPNVLDIIFIANFQHCNGYFIIRVFFAVSADLKRSFRVLCNPPAI